MSEAPDILLIRAAHARLRAGELEAAEVLCREALGGTAVQAEGWVPGRPRESHGADALKVSERPREPHRAHALNLLGAVLHASGRAGEAHEVFDELTRIEPDEARHWTNLGTVRRELGRYDQALDYLERSRRRYARRAIA